MRRTSFVPFSVSEPLNDLSARYVMSNLDEIAAEVES